MSDVPNQKRGLRPSWGAGKGAGTAYGSKGAGWGGEAKGAGSVSEPAAPFEKGNYAALGPHDMANSIRQTLLKDELFSIALDDPDSSRRTTAINSYLNRVEGMPVARQELTGKDGAPLVQVYLPANSRDVTE